MRSYYQEDIICNCHYHHDESHNGLKHGHQHDPRHGHPLSEEEQAKEDAKLAPVLLKYTLEHNEQHAAELTSLAARLKNAGCEESGEAVLQALELYEKGNQALATAVEKL